MVDVDPAAIPEHGAAGRRPERRVRRSSTSTTHVIVVDKPAGLVVHPGAGNPDGTLVNGLLARFPSSPASASRMRPGIVHRLDAGSSGLLVVARTDEAPTRAGRRSSPTAHRRATLRRRRVGPSRRAARHRSTRRSGATTATRCGWRSSSTAGRRAPSTRSLAAVRRLRPTGPCSSAGWRPGRTHQIRVHLAADRPPVVGDPIVRRAAHHARPRPAVPARRRAGLRPPDDRRAADVHQPAARRSGDMLATLHPSVRAIGASSGRLEHSMSVRPERQRSGTARRRAPGPPARSRRRGHRRRWRACSSRGGGASARRPTFQIASSTHWPSWSQAPSWCGSPKSPSVIGPSTAETISRQADLLRVPGQHVAAADAALGAHQAGALQREQDLLEVRLGQAGALGDVAHRRRPVVVGVQGERQQRPAGVVAPGRDPHDPHRTGLGPAASGLPAAGSA